MQTAKVMKFLTCSRQRLLECRDAVCAAHDLSPKNVELSMGMSGDFEHAVRTQDSSRNDYTNVQMEEIIFINVKEIQNTFIK